MTARREVGRESHVGNQRGAELEDETVGPPDPQVSGAAVRRLLQRSSAVEFAETDRPDVLRRLHIAAVCPL